MSGFTCNFIFAGDSLKPMSIQNFTSWLLYLFCLWHWFVFIIDIKAFDGIIKLHVLSASQLNLCFGTANKWFGTTRLNWWGIFINRFSWFSWRWDKLLLKVCFSFPTPLRTFITWIIWNHLSFEIRARLYMCYWLLQQN